MTEKRMGNTGAKPVADTNNGKQQKSDDSKEPLKTLTSLFTVEPILVIQMATAILAFMAVQDLIFEKACKVNLGYSDVVCSALKTG